MLGLVYNFMATVSEKFRRPLQSRKILRADRVVLRNEIIRVSMMQQYRGYHTMTQIFIAITESIRPPLKRTRFPLTPPRPSRHGPCTGWNSRMQMRYRMTLTSLASRQTRLWTKKMQRPSWMMLKIMVRSHRSPHPARITDRRLKCAMSPNQSSQEGEKQCEKLPEITSARHTGVIQEHSRKTRSRGGECEQQGQQCQQPKQTQL